MSAAERPVALGSSGHGDEVPRLTRGEIVQRLLLGHVLSLPLAIAWACAAMPPVIHLYADELMTIDRPEDMGPVIVRKVLYPAAVGFVLEHVAVVPWLAVGDPARGRRWFIAATAALYGLAALVGAAGWIWLFVREA